MNPTDVEISRALNAISTTLRDQRPSAFDAVRVQAIARGALAGEPKLSARANGDTSGELTLTLDGRVVATIELEDGRWSVERKLRAGGSDWALPQPAHREQEASDEDESEG
jgi:nitrogen fixation protein FixH